jgi:hypothetical protein
MIELYKLLNTPQKIADYIRKNIAWRNIIGEYTYEQWVGILSKLYKEGTYDFSIILKPEDMLERGVGSCYDIAMFASYCFLANGYTDVKLLSVQFELSPEGKWGDYVASNHALCWFKDKDKYGVIYSFMTDKQTILVEGLDGLSDLVVYLGTKGKHLKALDTFIMNEIDVLPSKRNEHYVIEKGVLVK